MKEKRGLICTLLALLLLAGLLPGLALSARAAEEEAYLWVASVPLEDDGDQVPAGRPASTPARRR